jgi:hypothetical protein
MYKTIDKETFFSWLLSQFLLIKSAVSLGRYVCTLQTINDGKALSIQGLLYVTLRIPVSITHFMDTVWKTWNYWRIYAYPFNAVRRKLLRFGRNFQHDFFNYLKIYFILLFFMPLMVFLSLETDNPDRFWLF